MKKNSVREEGCKIRLKIKTGPRFLQILLHHLKNVSLYLVVREEP